jgi:erythromycin esterase
MGLRVVHGERGRAAGSLRWIAPFAILGFLLPAAPLAAQDGDLVELLRDHAHALERPADLEPLVERARDRRLVLIGEASHGTREFYEWRADLSRLLIEDSGARFIAVEGEWSAIRKLDRYARHDPGAASSAREILEGLDRWPRWLWANETVEAFVEWLRDHNRDLPPEDQVALYGLDLNDPWGAIAPLEASLEELDSAHLDAVREAVRCLERYDRDPSGFVTAVVERDEDSCLEEAREVAEALTAEAEEQPEVMELFHAAQQSRVIAGAIEHFLALARAGPEAWNLRVDHFHTTVDRLLGKHSGASGIVWAHNTHVGDARASAMAVQGEENLGQRAREELGADEVFIVGFSTHRGRVIAGPAWDAGMLDMEVPEAARGSVEALLAQVGINAFYLFPGDAPLAEALADRMGHRAIGVVYDPEEDQQANYVGTDLPDRYDAFVFIRETRALEVIPGG